MEKETQSRDCKSPAQLPLKRKSDLVPVEEGEDERTVKQQKPDAPPLEELGDASLDEKKGGTDQNGNADGEKKEFVLPAVDKGKGKMVVEDEEGCDEEGGDEEGGNEEGGNEEGGDEEGGDEEEDDQESGDSDDDDEDETSKDVEAYLADDSLTEMDVDNILQERTRPRHSLKLGASVMEGKKDDVEDDGDYCEDEDDDEEEEEEEEEEKDGEQEEEEEKQESN